MKLLVALRARKFRFTMVQRVLFQIAFTFKTFVTCFTLEIFLLYVNRCMVFKIGVPGKSFVANGARVGFFPSVSPLVAFKVVFVVKNPETNFTLMRFVARIFAMQFYCGILEY